MGPTDEAPERTRERENGAPGPNIPWETIAAILGTGTALAAWITVVGGARVWARLHAAEVPASQTLAVLPRDLFLVEGLQTLVLPVLLGGTIAIVVYYARRRGIEDVAIREQLEAEQEEAVRRREERSPEPALPQEQLPTPDSFSWADTLRGSPRSGNPIGRMASSAAHGATRGAQSLEPLAVAGRLDNRYTAETLTFIVTACFAGLGVLTLAIVQVDPLWIVGASVAAVVLLVGLPRLGVHQGPTWLIAGGALLIGTVVAVLAVVEPVYAVAIAALTAVAVWVTFNALSQRSPAGVALTLFAAFAIWSGAVAFLRDFGELDPKLERAAVERDRQPTVTGLYLGGGSGDVYLASEKRPRTVTMVREEDVTSLRFGDSVELEELDEPDGGAGPTGGGGGGSDGSGTSDGGGGAEPPTPSPTPGAVLASEAGTLDGIPARLEIVGVERKRRLIGLSLRLRNESSTTDAIGRRLTIGALLDDGSAEDRGDDRDSLDGLQVIDLDGSRTRPVAEDSRGLCVCSRGLSRVAIEPGGAELLFATFSRPPPSGEDPIYLLAPHFPILVVATER